MYALLAVLLILLWESGTVFAASLSLNLPAVGGAEPGKSPAAFVNYIVVFSFVFVGALALVALLAGGFRYLTAAGNPSAESDAKDRIKSAIFGLIFVLAAISLLYTINPDFVRLRNPGIPILEIPTIVVIPPDDVPEGSCQLLSAAWDNNQACYNEVTKAFDRVSMVVQGRNCEGWGVSLNIVDASGATINQPVPVVLFDSSNVVQEQWQPLKTGTYTFIARAGEGDALTQKASGTLLVKDGLCVNTGGNCPTGGAVPPINYGDYAITVNSSLHKAPGSGHGWVSCQDPDCAVDLRVGKTCEEAHENALRGVPVFAPFSGKVMRNRSLGSQGEFGRYITITSKGLECVDDPFCAVLAHIDPSVAVGDTVQAGQQVGVLTTWDCGPNVFGPHLHFELKMDNQWIVGNGGNAFDGIATVPENSLYTIDRNQRTALAACTGS